MSKVGRVEGLTRDWAGDRVDKRDMLLVVGRSLAHFWMQFHRNSCEMKMDWGWIPSTVVVVTNGT